MTKLEYLYRRGTVSLVEFKDPALKYQIEALSCLIYSTVHMLSKFRNGNLIVQYSKGSHFLLILTAGSCEWLVILETTLMH